MTNYTFGKVRQSHSTVQGWHGTTLRPGMWFGEDIYGYWTSYLEQNINARYIVYRADRKTLRWRKTTERETSELTAKLNAISSDQRKHMEDLRKQDERMNGAQRRAARARMEAKAAEKEAKEAKKKKSEAKRKAKAQARKDERASEQALRAVAHKLDARTSLENLSPIIPKRSEDGGVYRTGASTHIEVTSNPRGGCVYTPERPLRLF